MPKDVRVTSCARLWRAGTLGDALPEWQERAVLAYRREHEHDSDGLARALARAGLIGVEEEQVSAPPRPNRAARRTAMRAAMEAAHAQEVARAEEERAREEERAAIVLPPPNGGGRFGLGPSLDAARKRRERMDEMIQRGLRTAAQSRFSTARAGEKFVRRETRNK